MKNSAAIQAGYTRQLEASSDHHELNLLVQPGADLDGSFIAWCCDGQEFIRVNGWLFSFSDVHSHA